NDEGAEVFKAKEIIVQEAEKPKEEETKVFDVVEQMPSFPGGMGALMQYLSSHIKYPVVAEENGIQGRVICTFIVERDGSITDTRVARSVDTSLDKEAVRVINSMPRWIPGKQNGSACRVKFTLPVTFKLQ
ncbi:MAG: energy transducer TonB, partial [Prevotella sp.]|nr:energy transducer TonB [Prevotella sp.]